MTSAGLAISENDLLAYADEAEDPARRGAVEAWLAEHPEDRERVNAWRRQTALLRAALDPVAEEPVPAALAAAVLTPPRRFPRMIAAAIAAVLLAFAGGLGAGWLIWSQPPAGGMAELARSGLAAHRVYVVEVRHPVEVGANEQQHLVSWLGKRLDRPVKAPDLSANGLKLLGGRLLAQGDGKPAALFMYEGASGERFTLFIERSGGVGESSLRYLKDDKIGAFYWVDDACGYVVSGPSDRDRLLKVAREVYDQLS